MARAVGWQLDLEDIISSAFAAAFSTELEESLLHHYLCKHPGTSPACSKGMLLSAQNKLTAQHA